MLISLWSVKGGAGTTVLASALAVVSARTSLTDVLLVDLAGDIPAVLGMPEPTTPGVADWLAAGAEVPDDGWSRLELDVADRVRLVPKGNAPVARSDRLEVLIELLGIDSRLVIVDCGVLEQPSRSPAGELSQSFAERSTQSLLVTRGCYLALRRAVVAPVVPSGVIVVKEAQRSLGVAEISDILGVPVVAEVDHDPSVARTVDAGLLATRLPRGLARELRGAA